MTSASLFEQLTSSVSLSLLPIVSVGFLGLLLLYTAVGRLFFSPSKSKASSSNQQPSKEKKVKESNATKKQQQTDVAPAPKKKNNKVKKAAALPAATQTAVSTGQSDESDDEKVAFVPPTPKKPITSTKTSTGKKAAATDEMKPAAIKQQQQAPAREENVEKQNGVLNTKQSKPVVQEASASNTSATNKPKPSGKRGDANPKVNNVAPKKVEPANAETKRTVTVDAEPGQDQEDEGQWLTQGSKQVHQRNRNKGKNESSTSNNQTTSAPIAPVEKRAPAPLPPSPPPPPPPAVSNVNPSSSANNTDVNSVESSIQNPEPIEIFQLLPSNNDLYTSNDKWWKHALNKQATFSVDDIGEWPDHEPDEQYIVQVKQIIPIKKAISNEV